jgi:very-short-patch-repair endonuclease
MMTTLHRRASAQLGLLTRAQAIAAGLTRRQIAYRLHTGAWQLAAPGVYRLAGTPPDPDLPLLAAVLATGGAASHRSAAHRLGLLGRRPVRPEITVGRGRSHPGAAIVHRPLDFAPSDVCDVRGIACTTATRTLVDLGAVVGAAVVDDALHRALRLDLTTYDDVVARYFSLSRPGRAGCGPLRAVLLEHDPAMAPAESDLETLLLRILRDAGLPEPARQHEVVVHGERFRIDIAYPELRIAIEGDGFGVHTEREQFERDHARQNLLVLDGWLILRFTWRQLCTRPEWVAAQVSAARSQSRRVRAQ